MISRVVSKGTVLTKGWYLYVGKIQGYGVGGGKKGFKDIHGTGNLFYISVQILVRYDRFLSSK